jgi:hypothetical protein
MAGGNPWMMAAKEGEKRGKKALTERSRTSYGARQT